MKIYKNVLILFGSVIASILLLWYVFKKYPLADALVSITGATPFLIILYLVVSACIMAIFTWRWKILLDAQGYKGPKFYELMSYRTIDYGVSYLTPTAKLAGEPVRAAMLMRNGISFKEGLTTITIDKTIELSFTIIIFAVGCFVLILNKALMGGVALFLAVLCCFLIFINWTFYHRILNGKPVFISLFRFLHLDKLKFLSKHQQSLIDFEKPILAFYLEKKKAYFKALGLTVLAFLLSLVEYAIILRMVGINASLEESFMVFSVVGMAFLIPVPMGLGSLEAMQAWLFTSLGFNSAAGVGVALITRARDICWVIFAVIFAVYYGSLKKVLAEAFNSRYSNPVVNMTLFRGGKESYVKIKMVRTSPPKKDWVGIGDISKPTLLPKKVLKPENKPAAQREKK